MHEKDSSPNGFWTGINKRLQLIRTTAANDSVKITRWETSPDTSIEKTNTLWPAPSYLTLIRTVPGLVVIQMTYQIQPLPVMQLSGRSPLMELSTLRRISTLSLDERTRTLHYPLQIIRRVYCSVEYLPSVHTSLITPRLTRLLHYLPNISIRVYSN